MKLHTQFTVPENKLSYLNFFKKLDLEKTHNREFQDYPTKEYCLVCCNWLLINLFFLLINYKYIQNLIDERLNYAIKIFANNYFYRDSKGDIFLMQVSSHLMYAI